MKNIPLISLLLVLLTACSTPTPSPTATMTALPTFTSTAIPEATLTLTPTLIQTAIEEVAKKGYLTDLHFKETDAIENYEYGKNGPVISVSFNVDETAWVHGVHEVTAPDELLADIGVEMLNALFAPDMEKKEFVRQWAEIQAGNRPVEDLQVVLNIFDCNKRTDKAEEMTMVLGGEGVELPEGNVGITNVNIVYGEWYENPEQGVFTVSEKHAWFELTTPSGSGRGIMVDKSKGVLYIFGGFSYLAEERNRDSQVATNTEFTKEWLKYFSSGRKLFVKSTQKYYELGKYLTSRGLKVK